MRKFLIAILCAVSCVCTLTACNKNNNEHDNVDNETVCAYCSEFYDVGFGNYGSFAVSPTEDFELETDFSDLTKYTLGGAFSGLQIEKAVLADDSYAVRFYVKGVLSEGDFGTVSGAGIIRGKSVDVSIPITTATASSDSKIYENLSEQKIEISLMSACFNKELAVSDFVLSGAASGMTVKSIEAVYGDSEQIDDDEEMLSQTALLTLTGEPNGKDYAYIEIASGATTYNKPLNLTVVTDYYGAHILNDHVDTFTLSDVVYIHTNNISFENKLSKSDITLDGAFKDYAVLEEIDLVNDSLLALRLSFPYTFLNVTESIGYIRFTENTNTEKIAFTCSAIVAAPDIDFEFKQNGKSIELKLTLSHEEFNLLPPYPITVYNADGEELLVTNLDIVDLDEYLKISFDLPDNCSGLIKFELADAYDIVTSDGQTKSISIKFDFYI